MTVPAIAGGGPFVRLCAVGGDGAGRPTLEIVGASVPSGADTQQFAALTASAGGTIAANGTVELDATDGGTTATPGERAGGAATLAGGPVVSSGRIVALSDSLNAQRDHLRASVTNQMTGVMQIADGFLDTDDGSTFQNLGTVVANGGGIWLITANQSFGGVPSRMINSGAVTTTGGVEVLDASWQQAGGVVTGAPIGSRTACSTTRAEPARSPCIPTRTRLPRDWPSPSRRGRRCRWPARPCSSRPRG